MRKSLQSTTCFCTQPLISSACAYPRSAQDAAPSLSNSRLKLAPAVNLPRFICACPRSFHDPDPGACSYNPLAPMETWMASLYVCAHRSANGQSWLAVYPLSAVGQHHELLLLHPCLLQGQASRPQRSEMRAIVEKHRMRALLSLTLQV